MQLLARCINKDFDSYALGLFRLGIGLILWSRFAYELGTVAAKRFELFPLFFIFLICSTTLLIGFWSRANALLCALTLTFILFYLGQESAIDFSYHTFFLLQTCLLLSLASCGNTFSLDSWRSSSQTANRKQSEFQNELTAVGIFLLKLSTSVIYFFGAIHKSNIHFLSGERLQMIAMWRFFGSDYPEMPLFKELTAAISVAVVLLEFLLAFGLWNAALRKFLIPLGLLFHFLIYLFLTPYTFSVQMCLSYILFLKPGTVRDSLKKMISEKKGSGVFS